MDHQRSSLPNVDRANSTLFKRYLEEQHKSIVKSNVHQSYLHQTNPNLQVQHHESHTIQAKTHYPTVFVKRKYSNGRKPSVESTKQRTSHTSRFMRRFQRHFKQGETQNQIKKREIRPQFEFHVPPVPPRLPTNENKRIDSDTKCTCAASSNLQVDHSSRSPLKLNPLSKFLSTEPMNLVSQQMKQNILASSSEPQHMVTSTMDDPTRSESISTENHPKDDDPLAKEIFFNDLTIPNLSDDQYALLNEFLDELSTELTERPSIDILIEIEGSLAQRIYECVVENEENNEQEVDSYTTPTLDSSIHSVPMNKMDERVVSSVKPTSEQLLFDSEKYFQPIREPPTPTIHPSIDPYKQTIPLISTVKSFTNDGSSPFVQSLFEPLNLLRTVANPKTIDENNFWHDFSQSFTSDPRQTNNSQETRPCPRNISHSTANTSAINKTNTFPMESSNPNVSSIAHHLLLPRTNLSDRTISAFKPIESISTRSVIFPTTSTVGCSVDSVWFGQS